MQVDDIVLSEEWKQLWEKWYENRAERDSINESLVRCKAVLRAQGISVAQPPPS